MPTEPQLHPFELAALRPTQMTVGMAEVERKQRAWRERARDVDGDWLGQHMIPAVLGPKARVWIIDHHHLALALHREGQRHVLVSIVARLDCLKPAQFLTFMDNRNWLHPFDETGDRRDYDALPKKLDRLADDPYRALAGEVRRGGGYAKSTTPFAEFLWADFLRHRVKLKHGAVDPRALERALALARSSDCAHLPGWCGPAGDG